jgi:hypothetical protein
VAQVGERGKRLEERVCSVEDHVRRTRELLGADDLAAKAAEDLALQVVRLCADEFAALGDMHNGSRTIGIRGIGAGGDVGLGGGSGGASISGGSSVTATLGSAKMMVLGQRPFTGSDGCGGCGGRGD